MRCNAGLGVRATMPPSFAGLVPEMSRVCRLTSADETETLEFLGIRPVHTVVMTSFINDNGIESPLNRGTFFGYRGAAGELEGIALIGHSTLVEARSEDALHALALAARTSAVPIKVIMSGGDVATSFWNYLFGPGRRPSLTFTELLFETNYPFVVQECEFELRTARPDELEVLANAHAEVAEIESGINPMDRDPDGFRQRVLRRIEQGRVFVVFEGQDLVFKTDIIAMTSKTAYLEGVYVSPKFRGRRIGAKCLSRVCTRLLEQLDNVCLLSNAEFRSAHTSFLSAGLRHTDACRTLFV